MTALGLITILSYAAKAVTTGVQVAQAVDIAIDALGQMKREGRDPTDAELDAIRRRIEDRGQRIQEA